MASLASAGDRVRGRVHQRQSAAQQEEQAELEEAVVPPEGQGPLHLQSSRGEAKPTRRSNAHKAGPLATCVLFPAGESRF